MGDARNSFGPFELDAAAGVLRRGGEVVPLGQRAFELLRALIEAEGAAVDKDALQTIEAEDLLQSRVLAGVPTRDAKVAS